VELRHLQAFDTVVRTGTVTAAAVTLDLAPSTVSEQIRALERSLAVTLFDRHTNGMHLTEDGRRLVGWARQILDLADRARRDLTGPRPQVRLGALQTLVATCVPAVLARLAARRPQLRVDVRPGTDRREMLADVRAGRLDAVLLLDTGTALGDLGFPPPPASLSFQDLDPVPLALVSAPDHLPPGRDADAGRPDLDGRRLLLNAPNCSFALAADKLLGPGAERTFVGSVATALAWSEQGLGVALLPAYAVTSALRAGTLTRHPVPLPDLTLRLVWRTGQEERPEVRDLLYAASI
jgi:DNA-binding transcriptional LysR family regulator